jgi:hypothetical protein
VIVPVLSKLANGVSALAGYTFEYVLVPVGRVLSVCASFFGSVLRMLARAFRFAATAAGAAFKASLAAMLAAATVVRDTVKALTMRR